MADYGTQPPGSDAGPFIMSAEGVGRLFAVDKITSGPMPEHYEPIESPIDTNPLHPKVVSDPTIRIYKEDANLSAQIKTSRMWQRLIV